LRYTWITIGHKWYVLLAGLKIGRIPLLHLIIHDWHKFLPSELPHYQRQFFGDKGDPVGFAQAWVHHQNFGWHHWEYWITRSDHSRGGSGAVDGCLEMPEIYVREMIADWMGASKMYTGSWDMREWLSKNLAKIKVHPKTEIRVKEILQELGQY